MKRTLLNFVGVIILILLFSIFIHPTVFYYGTTKYNEQSYVTKINRITGKAEIATPGGWIEVEGANE